MNATTSHTGKITLPTSLILPINNQKPIEMFILDFSPNYDILLGWDVMQTHNMTIDSGTKSLHTPLMEIPIHHTVSPQDPLADLLIRYENLFTDDVSKTCFPFIKHRIALLSDEPIYQRPYRLPQIQRTEVSRQVKEMLDNGIIRPSDSPWSSPVHLVEKKVLSENEPKKWRLVIDYRKLNEQTRSDKFPLPNIEDIFSKLNGSKYFSTLDLTAGYHQILMDPESIPLTAFSTPDGHYEYLRMPFGLKNAPATFQRIMNNILKKNIEDKECLVYLDDVVVFAPTVEEHHKNLENVLNTLYCAHLRVNREKCNFFQQQVAFLGHVLTQKGLQPDQSKIKAIQNYPLPRTVKEIRSFLGLVSYYRKFIPRLSHIIKPLTDCTKKNSKVEHSPAFREAFLKAKTLISNPPILAYPNFDKEFVVTTDASDIALGAVISQDHKPIAYASRTLSEAERKYNTTEKELLAIIYATTQFRPYIYGRKFTLETDHQPLSWLAKLKEPNARLNRWKLRLQEYDYSIKYKKGSTNYVADALSRIEIHAISDEATIHSNADDSSTGFGIKLAHPPYRMNRIIVSRDNTPDLKIENKENSTTDYYLKISAPHEFVNFVKDYCSKDRYALICHDQQLGQQLSELYRNHFNSNKLKIIWFTRIKEEINNSKEITDIIKKKHLMYGRHLGQPALAKEISQKYYIEKLNKHISSYLNNCNICQQCKYDRRPIKPPYEETPTMEKPMQKWQLDIFSFNSKKYLVGIDLFSKWAFAEELNTRNIDDVLKAFIKILSVVGKPKEISLDNERTFCSEAIKKFLDENGIEIHLTTPKHHTSHGDIERLQSTLGERLRVSPEADLSLIILGYNETIHSTTDKKPNDLHFLLQFEPLAMESSVIPYLQETYDKINKTKKYHIDRQNKARLPKEKVKQLAVGQQIYTAIGLAGKTKPKYKKVAQVTKILPRNVYEYKRPGSRTNSNNKQKIHISDLKAPKQLLLESKAPSSPTQAGSSKTGTDNGN